MLSKRKEYGAALLRLLDEEGQQSADNLGKAKPSILPEGRRWVKHGGTQTGSPNGSDSRKGDSNAG